MSLSWVFSYSKKLSTMILSLIDTTPHQWLMSHFLSRVFSILHQIISLFRTWSLLGRISIRGSFPCPTFLSLQSSFTLASRNDKWSNVLLRLNYFLLLRSIPMSHHLFHVLLTSLLHYDKVLVVALNISFLTLCLLIVCLTHFVVLSRHYLHYVILTLFNSHDNP